MQQAELVEQRGRDGIDLVGAEIAQQMIDGGERLRVVTPVAEVLHAQGFAGMQMLEREAARCLRFRADRQRQRGGASIGARRAGRGGAAVIRAGEFLEFPASFWELLLGEPAQTARHRSFGECGAPFRLDHLGANAWIASG